MTINTKIETKVDGKKYDYFSDLVTPQIEMNSIFKSYKAKKIEIYSEHSFPCSVDSEDSHNFGNSLKHILIERYSFNEKEVNIPIATFIPCPED